MQILYVAAMIAVSVLCIALLSTARRILHASPVAGTSMGVGSVSTLAAPVEASSLDWELEMPADNSTYAYGGSGAVIAPPAPAETVAAPEPPADAPRMQFLAFESAVAPLPAAPLTAPEPAPAVESAEKPRLGATSRRFFTCAFECAVLGVSAWVLIRTQKELHRTSTVRARHVA
jgi:hypothetical protein